MSLSLTSVLMLLSLLGLVVFGPVFGAWAIVRRVRWSGGRCAWCGYDLGERVGLVCPECGLGVAARRGRANRRLAGRLVLGGVLPTVAGVVLIGMVPAWQVWPMVWSLMPNDVVIRFSFGASPNRWAREEFEKRMYLPAAGGTGLPPLSVQPVAINPNAFTTAQWERIAEVILDDIEWLDAWVKPGTGPMELSYAEWLLFIPADAERIRERIAAIFKDGGDSARKNAFWLMQHRRPMRVNIPRQWEMDDRLCSHFIDVMLDSQDFRWSHQAALLFDKLCRCDFASLERYMRDASDERIALPGHHPSRFFRYSSVLSPEEAQEAFLMYERLRQDDDPNIQRFRQWLDFGYEFFRRGVTAERREVDGVVREERWSFTPKSREELEAEREAAGP